MWLKLNFATYERWFFSYKTVTNNNKKTPENREFTLPCMHIGEPSVYIYIYKKKRPRYCRDPLPVQMYDISRGYTTDFSLWEKGLDDSSPTENFNLGCDRVLPR